MKRKTLHGAFLSSGFVRFADGGAWRKAVISGAGRKAVISGAGRKKTRKSKPINRKRLCWTGAPPVYRLWRSGGAGKMKCGVELQCISRCTPVTVLRQGLPSRSGMIMVLCAGRHAGKDSGSTLFRPLAWSAGLYLSDAAEKDERIEMRG